jgi:probable rRNA maturation factor
MAPAKQNRNITVQIAPNFKNIKISLPKIKKLVKTICAHFKLSKAIVSIAIVDDDQIRKVNKEFLRKDRPTDCISFNLSDKKRNSAKSFELVVNAEMAARQAKLRGHSSEAELALYVTHGLLHNLGFNDSTKKTADKMHNAEDKILRQLGYGLVYNTAKK